MSRPDRSVTMKPSNQWHWTLKPRRFGPLPESRCTGTVGIPAYDSVGVEQELRPYYHSEEMT